MKKSFTLSAIIFAIVLVLFNVLFFVIPFPKNMTTWIEYAFSMVAIICGAGITCFAFGKGDDAKSRLYGFPILRVGVIYTAAQLIFAVIICIISFFVDVPLWISIVVSVLILGLSAIGVISTEVVREEVVRQEIKVKEVTKQMTYFKLDLQSVIDLCSNDELKKPLADLSEKFKYSDPVSSPELKPYEDVISSEIENLRPLINTDTDSAKAKIEEISKLLDDRNRRCKAGK